LVAAADAEAFVDACAAGSIRIWNIEAYRDDSDLVLLTDAARFFAGNGYRYNQPGQEEEWIESAREFLENVSAPGVWFDFVVSDTRLAKGENRPDWRQAPLPAVNPRLQLIDPAEVLALRRAVGALRYKAWVLLAARSGDRPTEDPRRLLRDLARLAFGEELPRHIRVESDERIWQPMQRDDALAFLTRVIAHDLAYGDREMSDDDARSIAECFLGLFGSATTFHTNFDIGDDGFPRSGFSLTEATMEAVLGASDGDRVGLFIVTGED